MKTSTILSFATLCNCFALGSAKPSNIECTVDRMPVFFKFEQKALRAEFGNLIYIGLTSEECMQMCKTGKVSSQCAKIVGQACRWPSGKALVFEECTPYYAQILF